MDAPQSHPRGRARGRPRGWHDTTGQNTIKSLDRAIMVLQHLSEIGAATLTGLAAETRQSPATLYRVLTTFRTRGLVEYDEAAQTWSVGAGAYLIGAAFLRRTSLAERARPVLRALMEATGETANLGVEQGGKVLFFSQAETRSNIRAFFPPGTMSDMHASGIGKALLAFMPEAQRDSMLAVATLTRFTAQTLTDRAALTADLDASRARGYAVDADEKTDGMRCIAAPVFDASGEAVAGISVSGPTARIPDADIPRFAAEVTAAARQLSAAMGAAGIRPTPPPWGQDE